jgi:hypothetical protein
MHHFSQYAVLMHRKPGVLFGGAGAGNPIKTIIGP